jgi:prepilin-type processing-associated H-X9-DG protein
MLWVDEGRSARCKGGFSLGELLVVIAAIALLAALLFPVFAQAREKAHQAVCFSNLRQVGMAHQMYTQDYDDAYLWTPPPGDTSAKLTASWPTSIRRGPCVDQPHVAWVVLVQPYLKGLGVLQCPDFPGFPLYGYLGYSGSLGPVRYRYVGYGINGFTLGDMCRPRSPASLRHPVSEVALFGDSDGPWSGIVNLEVWLRDRTANLYWDWTLYRRPVKKEKFEPLTRPRNFEGSNFVFADGHAKFLHPVTIGGWYPGAWGATCPATFPGRCWSSTGCGA